MSSDETKSKSELIAELQALRKQVRESADERFRTTLDGIPQCIYEVDTQGMLTYVNAFALNDFGLTREDIRNGLNVKDVIHPDSHAELEINFANVLAGKSDAGAEYLARRKDGSLMHAKVYSSRIMQDGEVVGLRGVLLDVSDMKAVEAALSQSENFYRTLFENTGTAMVIVDGNSVITSCNSQFAELSGYDRSEIEGKIKWTDMVDRRELARMQAYYNERTNGGHNTPDNYEFNFINGQGETQRIHIYIRMIPDTDSRVCSLIDVTDREQALEALRASEERYQLVTRGANDGVWDWDLRTNEVWYSSRYKEIVGYTDEDFPNHVDSWTNAVHPDDLEHTIAANTECVEGHVDQFEVEYRMIHKDGSIRWILGRGGSTRDKHGKVYRLAGTHTDITTRKLTEQTTNALYAISSAIATTRDLRELYETIHEIIGRAIHADNFFIVLHDEDTDSLQFVYFVDDKDDYYTITNVSDPDKNSLSIQVFRTGDPFKLSASDPEDIEEMRRVGILGTPPQSWLGVPLRLGGSVMGVMTVQDYEKTNVYSDEDVAFLTTVSEQVAMAIERKSNEEALTRLNEELESKVDQRTAELKEQAAELAEANKRLMELDEIKSSLVSSVSHELRTPLTSIRGFAKLCARDFSRYFSGPATDPKIAGKGERIRKNLDIIDTEGDRLTRLINDFLDINRIESGKASWHDHIIDPCGVIEKAVRVVTGSFEADAEVTLSVDLPAACQPLLADPDKIQQVLINLLNNAYKFTETGTVTVTLTQTVDSIMVSICDTGPGIPEEELPYLFDKFHRSASGDTVTSKHKGTGLGLAICKEIIEHYQGAIWVKSTMGKGSCFTFTLPTILGDA